LRAPSWLNCRGLFADEPLVKRVAIFSVLATAIFLVCFAVVWNVGRVLTQVVPSLHAVVAALTLAVSLAMTAGVMQRILSVRRSKHSRR
jgi:hypothetical protein